MGVGPFLLQSGGSVTPGAETWPVQPHGAGGSRRAPEVPIHSSSIHSSSVETRRAVPFCPRVRGEGFAYAVECS